MVVTKEFNSNLQTYDRRNYRNFWPKKDHDPNALDKTVD